ncbi:MAG: FAD-dependent oxidoreductase [Syntrophales bacterium]|nr:FAD-dependent oxidoreductase [Syntrophales bacterium]
MRYVIIGASAAGQAAAETLRQWDPQGSITVISDEAQPLYSRPLLTYLLSGEIRPEKVWLKGADYFQEWGFEARLGEEVVQVVPADREVRLASGRVCPYDRLLIASGARPKVPGIPGEDLEGVFTLRNLADWRRLESGLEGVRQVVVVGAGAVGLKTADALMRRGFEVTLLARGAQPLSRMLDATAAAMLMDAVATMGIDLRCHSWPVALKGDGGRVKKLILNSGEELPAQAVLFSVGVTANVDFLEGTGLGDPGGILVDRKLRSRDPRIFAAGDCCRPHHLLSPGQWPYHIWPAAVDQGRVAGANMGGGSRLYPGLLPQNSLSLRGFKIISGGLGPHDTKDCEIVAELDQSRGHYRRLAYREGRLVGLTLVGAVAHAGIYFQLMAQGLPAPEPVTPGLLWG